MSDDAVSRQSGVKARPLWRPLDSLRTSMVKQVFSREHFTHKKGLMFTPTVHADEGDPAGLDLSASEAPAQATDEAAHAGLDTQNPPADAAAQAPNIEELRAQAFALGLAQGLAQGQAQASQTQAANEQEALAAQAHAQTQALLQAIDHKVDALVEDPAQLQEPLKRLALHLAEQLILTELSLSPQAVAHLIERCMDTLDASDPSAMVVELNPQDLALLNNQQRADGESKPAWRLQADALLLPGSVRVRADDAVVSDLIENRLESLATSLLKDPQAWQKQSAFAPAKMASRLAAQRGSAHTVEDAQAKPATMPAHSAFDGAREAPASVEDAAIDEAPDALDAHDPEAELGEQHTYEPQPARKLTPPPPEAVTQPFHEALSDISLELDKLDE